MTSYCTWFAFNLSLQNVHCTDCDRNCVYMRDYTVMVFGFIFFLSFSTNVLVQFLLLKWWVSSKHVATSIKFISTLWEVYPSQHQHPLLVLKQQYHKTIIQILSPTKYCVRVTWLKVTMYNIGKIYFLTNWTSRQWHIIYFCLYRIKYHLFIVVSYFFYTITGCFKKTASGYRSRKATSHVQILVNLVASSNCIVLWLMSAFVSSHLCFNMICLVNIPVIRHRFHSLLYSKAVWENRQEQRSENGNNVRKMFWYSCRFHCLLQPSQEYSHLQTRKAQT